MYPLSRSGLDLACKGAPTRPIYLYSPNFDFIVIYCRLCAEKNRRNILIVRLYRIYIVVLFTNFAIFAGFCTQSPSWPNLSRESARLPVCSSVPNFTHGLVHLIARGRAHILPHFHLQHCAWVETKLNAGAQLQTFPCLTTSETFPGSSALIAKSLAQTIPFKSVMHKKSRNTHRRSPWHSRL